MTTGPRRPSRDTATDRPLNHTAQPPMEQRGQVALSRAGGPLGPWRLRRARAVSLKTVPWCFSTLPSSLGLLVGRHGGGPGAVLPHVGRTALQCDASWGPPPAREAIVR